MTNTIGSSIAVSAAGLLAQAKRMSVVAENIANSQSTGSVSGSDAYRRKTVSFEVSSGSLGAVPLVSVGETGIDTSEFRLEHSPSHPAADERGFVKMPNVDLAVELADMREAARSYQANVQAIKQARELVSMTINMLGGQS